MHFWKNYILFKKKYLTGGGFTLLELMVSIGILGIITTISLVNYRGGGNANALQLQAYKMAVDLRYAQTLALNSSIFNGSVPAGGWGVAYTAGADSYVIFADVDSGVDYDVSELYKTVPLSANLIFGGTGNIVITFEPPDATAHFNDLGINEQTITFTNNMDISTVLVNSVGLIDVTN